MEDKKELEDIETCEFCMKLNQNSSTTIGKLKSYSLKEITNYYLEKNIGWAIK